MRIEGPNKSSSSSSTSKTKKSGSATGTSFSALVESMSEKSEVGGGASDVSAVSSVGVVDALLAVQEDGRKGSVAANARMQQRAEEVLASLDSIKSSLLSGNISGAELQNILNLISQKKEIDIDPLLSEIIDEIDLRAQVELAKLGKI